jgi:hypothetical protein
MIGVGIQWLRAAFRLDSDKAVKACDFELINFKLLFARIRDDLTYVLQSST